ncbi:MAG TPA: hypothetical protein VMT35_04735 [Ignavibacteriaceae bacterium]|nr:hypothetical protein [Ignavibacteriaceae bacterium]
MKIFFVSLLLLIIIPHSVYSQIPRIISYQGIITDKSGNAKPDGQYNFTFRLYDAGSGGNILWSESKRLNVNKGLFATNLGDQVPFGNNIKFDKQYWLSTQVAPDPELSPRTALTSVAYSISSINSDTANYAKQFKINNGQVVQSINGLHDNLTMRAENGASVTTNGDTITITASGGSGGGIATIQNTNNTIDIIKPGGPTTTVNVKVPLSLSGTGSSLFSATNTGANSIGVLGKDDQAGGVGVWGQSDANTGVYGLSTSGKGVWGQSTSSAGVYGISSNSAGVYGQTSSSGLGAAGVRGLNLAAGGIGVQGSAYVENGIGVWGGSDVGTGVYGFSGSGTAIFGEATGLSTVGVRGLANASGGVGLWGQSDNNTGVYGLTKSSTGVAVLGQNQSTGPDATAIRGEITSTDPGPSSAAVKGINNGIGSNGIGVWGEQHGRGYGVYGSAVPDGTGVYGTGGTGVYGTSSTPGAGVVGHSTGSPSNYFGALGYHTSTEDYEVYGNAPNSGGYAGYFNGAVIVANPQGDDYPLVVGSDINGFSAEFNGTVSIFGELHVSGDKDFMIDHPLDPANKYLLHSCIESPDRMNVYNGNITTDAGGSATVELPGYFEALNIDYRYQLTVIGQFAQAIVESEIQNNHFIIKTDKPNVKVSWQVTGIRNDEYAKQHPFIAERIKEEKNKGKYLMPELFKQPVEKRINYVKPHEITEKIIPTDLTK